MGCEQALPAKWETSRSSRADVTLWVVLHKPKELAALILVAKVPPHLVVHQREQRAPQQAALCIRQPEVQQRPAPSLGRLGAARRQRLLRCRHLRSTLHLKQGQRLQQPLQGSREASTSCVAFLRKDPPPTSGPP